MADWKTKLAKSKELNQSESNEVKGETWKFISKNIGESLGDYRGGRDITRLRESILNRAKQ